MNKRETVLAAILEQGMLPLFYHYDIAASIAILKTLYHSGVRVFEFTNRGAEAVEVFKALLAARDIDMPDLYVGIGTIKNSAEAELFLDLGADFMVSPTVNAAVGELVHGAGLLWVPGCMTPTEIHTAQTYGASLIKLFPANVLGPGFMSAIRELFRGQLFLPTGGVDLELNNLKSWFDAGVCAVGMGSKLIDPNNREGLAEKTTKALELVREAKKEK